MKNERKSLGTKPRNARSRGGNSLGRTGSFHGMSDGTEYYINLCTAELKELLETVNGLEVRLKDHPRKDYKDVKETIAIIQKAKKLFEEKLEIINGFV